MRTLILYYSYSGNTKLLAKELAAELCADLQKIQDEQRPGKLKAYALGCFAALKGTAWPVKALQADLSAYERIVLMAPVWAGHVPPAVNAVWALLPQGTALEVRLVSASGESNCRARLETTLQGKGCTLASLDDIRMR